VGDRVHELEVALDQVTERSEAPFGRTRPIFAAMT
jgi:hypothetical protein